MVCLAPADRREAQRRDLTAAGRGVQGAKRYRGDEQLDSPSCPRLLPGIHVFLWRRPEKKDVDGRNDPPGCRRPRKRTIQYSATDAPVISVTRPLMHYAGRREQVTLQGKHVGAPTRGRLLLIS